MLCFTPNFMFARKIFQNGKQYLLGLADIQHCRTSFLVGRHRNNAAKCAQDHSYLLTCNENKEKLSDKGLKSEYR